MINAAELQTDSGVRALQRRDALLWNQQLWNLLAVSLNTVHQKYKLFKKEVQAYLRGEDFYLGDQVPTQIGRFLLALLRKEVDAHCSSDRFVSTAERAVVGF